MKHCLLFLVLLVIGSSTWAVDRPAPLSFGLERQAITPLNQVEEIQFDALDLEALAQADAMRESGGGNIRFAFPHEVVLSTDRFGQWDEVDGTSIWRLRVFADEATLLNFGFEDVNLPEGSQLFVYDPKAVGETPIDTYRVIGPYGAEINQNDGVFWTPNLYGAHAVIEASVPTAVRDQFSLSVKQVSHGYRGFGTKAPNYQQVIEGLTGEGKQSCSTLGGAGGRSGSCNQDVACLSEDDPWNLPRRSVGAYQVSGTDFCTGSLVNNTNNDQRMLFMTARHCIGPSDAPNVVIFWNYEWPTCRRPGDPEGSQVQPPDPNQSSSGTTFIANTVNPFGGGGCTDGTECSDMMLVEVNDEPQEAWNLYWSGWDRRPPPTICAQGPGNSTDGLCASIHHPGVDEKRITWVAQDIEIGSIAGSDNVHWHPFWHTNPPELPNMPAGGPLPPAVTEGGSSGSPLYSADRRLIGVLSGGPAFCGATGNSLSDFYGGLFHGWEGLDPNDDTTRMRPHLDPVGTNPEFIDGSGDTGFALSADPTQINQCDFADIVIDLDLTASGGFADPVTLSASNLPGSATAAFTINPVTPPGASVLTLGNLASAGAGSYTIDIEGNSGDLGRLVPISLVLSDDRPGATSITSPVDQEIGVDVMPTITWTESTQGQEYLLEIARDPQFTQVVYSVTVEGTSHDVAIELNPSTNYFVLITPSNECGAGVPSVAIQFTTEALPGDCPIDTDEQGLLIEGFDSPTLPAGWSIADSTGAANWVVSTAQVHSGTHSMFAENVDAVSDQRLTSPAFTLPADAIDLIMTFESWQFVESSGTGCWDGGLLEITTDGGTTWDQVDAPDLEERAYDGPIGATFDNPLEGRNAWCGDPRDDFERYVVDLSRWAGETVQLRWRFGTDRSVGRTGMHIDSVRVKACTVDPKEFIYNDRFEF